MLFFGLILPKTYLENNNDLIEMHKNVLESAMENKTVVVTGGNDGIGYYTCLNLAQLGANVIMLCRNEHKAQMATQKIQHRTGNKKVSYVLGDLSHMESVRIAALQILNRVQVIDVLINNAGAAFSKFEKSRDGFEMTFATNHLGCFLLTGLLLKAIQNSSSGRIINVSSHSHYRGKIDFSSISDAQGYSLMKSYEQSKLANVMFTVELAERLKNSTITVNCLHPGKVNTSMGQKAGQGNFITQLMVSGMQLFTRIFGISAEAGAITSTYLAVSDEVKTVSGEYFSKCKLKKMNPLARHKEMRAKLWQMSEAMVGFSFPLSEYGKLYHINMEQKHTP